MTHPPSARQPPWRSRHPRLVAAAIGLALALLILAVADVALPARADLLGLSRVFAPYLALIFLPLLAMAFLIGGRGRTVLGVLAIIGLGLGILRVLPGLPAGPVQAEASLPHVQVASWNLLYGAVPESLLVPALLDRAPAIVGLQEVTPETAAVLETDARLRRSYPYRVIDPDDDWSGMALLSSWPIGAEVEFSRKPPLIAATVHPDGSDSLDVLVAHTQRPELGVGPLGPTFDPTRRDDSLRTLRDRLEASIAVGRRTVLLGDLNLTDREVAYTEIADGLADAHLVAGSGLGHTWGPSNAAGLPLSLLRIDMVLVGPGLAPIASAPDCTSRGSDHCMLDVTLVIEPD